jgi:hypothetical protein
MTKKQKFIETLDNNFFSQIDVNDIDPDVLAYWEAFKGVGETAKPMFTDNGKLILQYMQDNQDTPMWKARDIGEGLFISSRGVSGAMRKLVTDGYVEKIGKDPTVYALTDSGKTVEIV